MFALLATALAWTPTAAEREVVQALSHRESPPSCAEIAERVPDARATLEAIVANVKGPAWVPMRAAGCLITDHADAASDTLLGWLDDPDTLGLAKLLLNHVDALPEELATLVARRALAGPHAAVARRPLGRSIRPAVQNELR